MATLLVALGDTVASFWRLWNDSDAYGHGIFVVPIVAYAIWVQRAELAARNPRIAWLGLLPLAVGLAGWFVAALADIEVGMQLGLALALIALVLLHLGWRLSITLWFPILFPLLAIPVWELIVPILQLHTANVVAWTLRTVGVPVYIEGFFIAIPSGNFEIAEVCAGLRYLLAMVSIGLLFAFLNGLTPLSVLAFVIASFAWAILFNWIRVFGIVLAGHLSEMQSDLVHDHYTYGWILFAVALVPLMYAGRLLPYRQASSAGETTAAMTGAGPARYLAVAGLASLVVVSVALVFGHITAREVTLASTPQFPQSAGGWALETSSTPEWNPKFPGAAWRDVATYRQGADSRIAVFVAAYAKEGQGAELINSENRVYDAERWSLVGNPRSLDASDTGGIPMRETILRGSSGRARIVWHTYRIAGGFTQAGIKAKLRQIAPIVSGAPSGLVLAISADESFDRETARARLSDFSQASVVPILNSIEAAMSAAKR